MTQAEFEELAKYNSETDKTKYTLRYMRKMRALQEKYNSELIESALRLGLHVINPTQERLNRGVD